MGHSEPIEMRYYTWHSLPRMDVSGCRWHETKRTIGECNQMHSIDTAFSRRYITLPFRQFRPVT